MKKITALIFAAIAIWFTWLNWYPGYKDSDGFYHAKVVELMRDHGLVRDFHWLPLTVLSDHFADHHLLYHLAIVPVAKIVSPLVAVKIVSVALGFLVCVLLYHIMRRMKSPHPEFLILLLAITPYFALRATMAKASGAAMLVQLALFASILFGKRLAMFCLSVVYVWAHGGFPFALIIITAFAAAKVFTRSAEGGTFKAVLAEVWREKWKNTAAIILGLLAGLIINPYFPENLYFYWHQIVQIAVVGTPKELLVGAEWYGVSPQEFFSISWPLMASLLIPIAALVILKRVPTWHRETAERFLFLFLLVAITFILTMRSNRHAEYFLPYFTIFIGEVHRITLPLIDWKLVHERVSARLRTKSLRAFALIAASLVFFSPFAELAMTATWMRTETLPFDGAKNVAEFVRKTAEPNEIVFDGNWDYFPQLWYWNDQNRYINGLDPRFFGAKNPELAIIYQDLNKKNEPIRDIFAKFPVRYIVMPKQELREKALVELKKDTQNFAQIYEDSSAAVFVKKY